MDFFPLQPLSQELQLKGLFLIKIEIICLNILLILRFTFRVPGDFDITNNTTIATYRNQGKGKYQCKKCVGF